MIKKQAYNKGKCWWCGKPANSQEHRHKKSDVKRIFGNKFENEPVIIRDSKHKDIQGPNSRFLKFPRVLCQDCNNSKSQPFDRAYDLFVGYILNNYKLVLERRKINLIDVFNSKDIKFKQDFLRYLTKSFCCRLASNNFTIEQQIIDFLDYKCSLDFIYFKFEIWPELFPFSYDPETNISGGSLYLSPLRYCQSDDGNRINLVWQFYNLQWLKIYTFYSDKMTEKNYPGYNEYNNSDTLQIEVKYSETSKKSLDYGINSKSKKQDEDAFLKEYLDTDIFYKN